MIQLREDIIKALIGFKDFVLDIPNKIADGFKFIFGKIKNFFIDLILFNFLLWI